MSISVRKLEFVSQGALSHPRDLEFFQRVDKFCEEQMAVKPRLDWYLGAWAAESEQGEILAVGGVKLIPDVAIRVKHHKQSSHAMKALTDRLNDYLHDNGYRDQEVLIHKAAHEKKEQACPRWRHWLKAFKATPADRYVVKVK